MIPLASLGGGEGECALPDASKPCRAFPSSRVVDIVYLFSDPEKGALRPSIINSDGRLVVSISRVPKCNFWLHRHIGPFCGEQMWRCYATGEGHLQPSEKLVSKSSRCSPLTKNFAVRPYGASAGSSPCGGEEASSQNEALLLLSFSCRVHCTAALQIHWSRSLSFLFSRRTKCTPHGVFLGRVFLFLSLKR